ncbi:MAG: hypothetical protein HYX92_07080 [Chloroflexi bacterium]|nr:hypothetical protein [Chloroflexota bacterium]
MGKYLVVLAILAQFVFPLATSLRAETMDKLVTGRIRNGTPGGEAVGQTEVTLKTFDRDKEAGSVNVRTDASGAFRFSKVPHSSGWMHTVSAQYREVEYFAQAFSIPDDQEVKEVELLVYELTDSDKAIKLERSHAVIEVDPETQEIFVVEYGVFVNEGDRTLAGVKGPGGRGVATLRFSVPLGAQDLRGQFGRVPLGLLPSEDSFTANHPVPPGATDVSLYYRLAYNSSDFAITRSVPYQAKVADVFFGDVGANVNVKGLVSKGPFDAQRRSGESPYDGQRRKYLYFSGQDVPAGADLTISLSNLPLKSPFPMWLWPALAVVPVAAGVGFVYMRSRALRPAAAPSGASEAMGLASRRQSLLAQIADLDDRREAGAVLEEEYRALRVQKKAELLALLRRGQPTTRSGEAPVSNNGPAAPSGRREGQED